MADNLLFTIDASVFVAMLLEEKQSTLCLELLALIEARQVKILIPNITLTEVMAAVFRVTPDKIARNEAENLISSLRSLPNFAVCDINSRVITKSFDVITTDSLRGMDALYVSVAILNSSTLVSLDKDQLKVKRTDLKCIDVKAALKLLNA